MDSNHRYRVKTILFGCPLGPRNSPSATKTGSFVPGTDGSNPSPSSGEPCNTWENLPAEGAVEIVPGGRSAVRRGMEFTSDPRLSAVDFAYSAASGVAPAQAIARVPGGG